MIPIDKIKLGILNIRRLMKNYRVSTRRIEFESHSYGRVTEIIEGRNCSQNWMNEWIATT